MTEYTITRQTVPSVKRDEFMAYDGDNYFVTGPGAHHEQICVCMNEAAAEKWCKLLNAGVAALKAKEADHA